MQTLQEQVTEKESDSARGGREEWKAGKRERIVLERTAHKKSWKCQGGRQKHGHRVVKQALTPAIH